MEKFHDIRPNCILALVKCSFANNTEQIKQNFLCLSLELSSIIDQGEKRLTRLTMRWRFSVRICRLSLSLAINHAFGINSRDEAAIFAITKLTDIPCILLSLFGRKISRQKIVLIRAVRNKWHMSLLRFNSIERLANSSFVPKRIKLLAHIYIFLWDVKFSWRIYYSL